MLKKTQNVLKDYIKNLIQSIIRDDFANAAGEMAYMTALGIFPFMLFLTAVFGWLGKTFFINKIIFGLSTIAPQGVIDLINGVLAEVVIFKSGKTMAIVGFLVTVFLTSNAIAVIIKGLNRANNIQENRSFFKVRLLAILMVFVNTFFLFISINLIVLGKVILNFIGTYLSIAQNIIDTILITRWPAAFLLMFLLAAINYYVLPARDFSAKRKSVIPGALFFCIFWLLGSWGFSLYVNALGTYNKVYGTIGIFAILMVWLYYSSVILLIGGQINNQTLRKLIILDKKKQKLTE
ncbi:MAG: YihY/virulence factor BrkB family protein [Cyanobacteria bacterium SIG27]|nr:YihY/virulence factor BrkB family protein [Cyanobacteria bacterium SIG27]MBQ9150274.1 YihY/virulence factor BrkB family protein [bacterium]